MERCDDETVLAVEMADLKEKLKSISSKGGIGPGVTLEIGERPW